MSPIKPENKAKYPKDWKAIRTEILERADHKCEKCGVENYAIIERGKAAWGSPVYRITPEDGWRFASDGRPLPKENDAFSIRKVKIVLTIAHLDHDPTNNGEPGDRPNLRSLCQRCHLRYDHQHHMANAARTRSKKNEPRA